MSADKRLVDARDLSQLLIDVAELTKSRFAKIAEELAVPVQVARGICLLQTPVPMNELAAMLACDKSYITPLADHMESLGLVTRVPGEDRRTKFLALTPSGKKMRQRLAEKVTESSPVMMALDESQRIAFEQILKQILSNSGG